MMLKLSSENLKNIDSVKKIFLTEKNKLKNNLFTIYKELNAVNLTQILLMY